MSAFDPKRSEEVLVRSHRVVGGLGLVGLLSLFLAAPAMAQPAATRITGNVHVGPYRVGMTADEVQAAAPAVTWDVERTETGAVRLLRAANGLSLAGQLFEVVAVFDDGYGKYLLGFNSRTMIDMNTCEENFLAVVGEMEKQLGVFSPSSSFVVPVAETVMAAGRVSTVKFDKGGRNAIWDTVRLVPSPYDGYYAQLHAHLNDERLEIDGCFISVDIFYEPALAE
jgi:hypothetical protein